jgi:hypothetical protein
MKRTVTLIFVVIVIVSECSSIRQSCKPELTVQSAGNGQIRFEDHGQLREKSVPPVSPVGNQYPSLARIEDLVTHVMVEQSACVPLNGIAAAEYETRRM